MARAYYNEWDPYAAAWLRNLIAARLIPAGDVDGRSIADVSPGDLAGYTQCHFFAGIGGWAYAADLAGWPRDRPLWTGSCPCQPFSVAGKRQGFDDQRHLWPEFHRLIAERRPAVVFGEQVAGASDWLGIVRGDLEALDYAVGAIPIEAASAGADHYRDRYWFVAADAAPQEGWRRISGSLKGPGTAHQRAPSQSAGSGESNGCTMADGHGQRLEKPLRDRGDAEPERSSAARGHLRHVVDAPSLGWGEGWSEHEFRSRGFTAAVASIGDRQYVECPDGKWRRLPPPRVRWLGNGIPARVAKLRAFGNAIDPRVAAEFIRAYMEGAPVSASARRTDETPAWH